MASEIELKPCPFCGGKAIDFEDKAMSIESGMSCVRSFIVCSDCSAIVSGVTEAEAADAWNRRVK